MKLNYLFLFLFSFHAFSNVELRLSSLSKSIKQGELIDAQIHLEQTAGQNGLKGLSGKHFAETLFIYSMEPFFLKNGRMESKVKVVFSKVPTSNSLQDQIEGSLYTITWTGLEITPTEVTEGFKFGSFELPKTWPLWIILLSLLTVLGLIFSIRFMLKRKKEKDQKKKFIQACYSQLESASTYEEIEAVWFQRDKYVKTFPVIADDFKNFEKILNKHQFKRERKSHEINEIQEAYARFKQQIKGVLNGI